jgi:Rhodopirellula transposase DDE domain
VILSLIAGTTTTKGLTVESYLDMDRYELGRKVSDEEMASVCVERDAFHGEWNYTILPRTSPLD